MPRHAAIASAIREARSGAISAADRAVLADVEWRNRSAADNSARVALAVLDYAAGIAEAAEDGVEQRIRKMVEDGYRRDGQTRWSGGEILEQLGAVEGGGDVTPIDAARALKDDGFGGGVRAYRILMQLERELTVNASEPDVVTICRDLVRAALGLPK